MAIVKRLGPEGRLVARMGEDWKRLLLAPIIAGMVNPKFTHSIPADITSLADLVGRFHDRNWITAVSWNEKIFMYAAGMVARRADVPGFLPDEIMTQLARHMNATTTLDKIDKGDSSVSLHMRMVFIWELPDFIKLYKGPGSYTLPELAAHTPVKPKRVKLLQHRK